MAKNATTDNKHWAEQAADRMLEQFPDESLYTVAAGISPSGTIHFGNFRDVMTPVAVAKALQERGKQVRVLYSWDDFDRFRKVPAGIDESYAEHIGKPLSKIPAPDGTSESYAAQFEAEFEVSMQALEIELDYKYQTRLYEAGTYDELIIKALQAREQIADILLSFMSDKAKKGQSIVDAAYREKYYPVNIYSEFSGKDFTEVLEYDGDRTLRYRDKESGEEGTVVIGQNRNLKLGWKPDWAMRWHFENVTFEPAGVDHASPGSSYDVSSRITKEIFGHEPPVFLGYGFVGLAGEAGKMSGSSGTGISPGQLADVYELPMIKWLYLRREPKQNFSLAFDTEIFRQYDEYDRETAALREGSLPAARRRALELAGAGDAPDNPIPFRQAVAFGQILQWDAAKTTELLKASGTSYDATSVDSRLSRARHWLETYNPEAAIRVRTEPNTEYAAGLDEAAKDHIHQLREALGGEVADIATLNDLVYGIPKDESLSDEENKPRQRAFFKDVYNLLIGTDTGPRLSTFLWALDRQQVLKLLDV